MDSFPLEANFLQKDECCLPNIFSASLNSKTSCPAGTGVCVVKCNFCLTSSKLSPSSISPSAANAVCPSLRWIPLIGHRSNFLIAITPPIPKIYSCRILTSVPPPYNLFPSSRILDLLRS